MISSSILGQKKLIGRFELRKIQESSPTMESWIAFDPRMEREVAVRILKPSQGEVHSGWPNERSTGETGSWLQSARSASRLKHPHINLLFEADLHGKIPYLVYEQSRGEPLDKKLQRQGPLQPLVACKLAMEILDALNLAHSSNITHQSIKASSVLFSEQGHAVLTDFGLSHKRYDAAAVAQDVFDIARLLAHMLTGDQSQESIASISKDGASFSLKSIIQKALSKDVDQRFQSARDLLLALEQWLKSEKSTSTDQADSSNPNSGDSIESNATLEFLIRRMKHKSDFPAMSESIIKIQKIASSEKENVSTITNEVLKDVALTNKLLKMVNSAYYAQRGEVSTVSRAVTLIGLNGIRNMSLSMVLLESMQDKGHASQLREDFLRSMLAGTVASEMCRISRDSEYAFLGALFRNLGRMLTSFYFPDESQQIKNLISTRGPGINAKPFTNPLAGIDSKQPLLSESQAAMRVLGITFEDLGLGVAKLWGLPQDIQGCISRVEQDPPRRPAANEAQKTIWLAMAANEIADQLLVSEPGNCAASIEKVAQKYKIVLSAKSSEFHDATTSSQKKMREMANAMDMKIYPGSRIERLLGGSHPEPKEAASSGSITQFQLQAASKPVQDGCDIGIQDIQNEIPSISQRLAAGIQDATNAMVEDFKLTDVVRMILETMYRSLNFDRIIFCMIDPKSQIVKARFGLGKNIESQLQIFKFNLGAQEPNLFEQICNKGSDTLISDASEAQVSSRIPEWHKSAFKAQALLLLPLQIKGKPFGLIYADKAEKNSMTGLHEHELSLLRTLRNQAVMAFRQSNH
jgi:eukaryotic-like serine/threonine-protein kinase